MVDDERTIGIGTIGIDTRAPILTGGNSTQLEVGPERFPWVETYDFPTQDPWSLHTRSVLAAIRAKGGFHGDFFEAGVGDGRNIPAAGVHENGAIIRGVDLDPWRLNIASHNLDTLGIPPSRLDLQAGDVVTYLRDLQGERLTGWGVACLPQAPGFETHNDADGYDSELVSLASVRDMKLAGHAVDEVGLTLIAAFLKILSRRVDKSDFNLILTLSDRIPPGIREALFSQTGWEAVREYRTETPIQQDPDTGVSYVHTFDDGQRFHERTASGEYASIFAGEAEQRRVASELDGGRASLNVYHHLSVYHLRPGETLVYESE